MQVVRCYARVSTDEQAQEGFSVAAQRQRLADFCRSQGWAIADWYVDEGKSAKDLDRPELSRLRQDLRSGEYVIVYRLDRLTRSVLDLYSLLAEWDQRQVGFRSSTELYDTTTALGKLFLTLVAALAQWERENLAERVRFGMTQMVREGIWYGGAPPFGYDVQEQRLVVNPQESAIVKEIYHRYSHGHGCRSIAVWLNEELGLRTKQGSAWSPFTVQWILGEQRPTYLGNMVWGKKGKEATRVIAQGTHEPIISQEEAAAVEAIRKRNKELHPREVASQFALTGIAVCGLCGARVSGHTQPQYDRKTGEKRWTSRRYMCQERKRRKRCSLPMIRAEKLEAMVLEEISHLANPQRLRDVAMQVEQPNVEQEIVGIKSELAKIKVIKGRYYRAFEEGLPASDIKERLAELSQREETINQRLSDLARVTPPLSVDEVAVALQDFGWHWRHATVEEQKALLSEFFESITVFADHVEVRPKVLM